MKQLPSLEEVLSYQNTTVIEQFRQHFPASAHEAEILFRQMLSYLWLCKKHQELQRANPEDPDLQFTPVIHDEMRMIDQMWHEFILSTQDYHQFCQDYFGEYLHHLPHSSSPEEVDEEEYRQALERYLNFVYDHLGEETLTYWFQTHLSAE